jgi:hypothetical protein
MPTKMNTSENIWSMKVAVEDIPEGGAHFDLDADEETRAALARAAGLRSLPRLHASFDVLRHGRGGLHIVGEVSATVGQNCVITLQPLDNEVCESVDLVFTPSESGSIANEAGEATVSFVSEEPPEVLSGGVVDLGTVATEFLFLGIDPYPKTEGATFESPAAGEAGSRPFAALAALKKRPSGPKH